MEPETPSVEGSSSGTARSRTASGVIPSATGASKSGTGRRSLGTRCPVCWTTSSISPRLWSASFSWKRPVLSFRTREPDMSAVPTIEPTTTRTVFHLRRVRFRRPSRLRAGRRSIEKRTATVTKNAAPKKITEYNPENPLC